MNIVDIETIALDTSLTIQCISELNGAIKNSIFANINTHIVSNISFIFNHKNNHQAETIKLYQTRV